MVTIREWYERVNAAWPKPVPKLTEAAAINATRRLYRFATGKKLGWRINITSGNRYTWGRAGVMNVNPTKGWQSFVHDFSHWLDRVGLWLGKPGHKPHRREHAKLELRLVREVVKRGWLNPEPVAEPEPAPVPPKPNEVAAAKLDHARKMLRKAETRHKRAQTIRAKWAKKVGRLERAASKGGA